MAVLSEDDGSCLPTHQEGDWLGEALLAFSAYIMERTTPSASPRFAIPGGPTANIINIYPSLGISACSTALMKQPY